MRMVSIRFRGDRCFSKTWAGFEAFQPINVVIGRNNSGKSQLLELVRIACEAKLPAKRWEFQVTGILDEASLRRVFKESTSGGNLGGNHWIHHGARLVGLPIQWEVSRTGEPRELNALDKELAGELTTERRQHLAPVIAGATPAMAGKVFRHLLADRDIRTEEATAELSLSPAGTGATNIIRRLIVSSSPRLPRELIQRDLRHALNKIFGSDGQFSEIQVQQHDEQEEGDKDHWEVFLGEERKGLIALSKSGSGLKTVILVLLNLLVIPAISSKQPSDFVFAFEELENNLHPSLLRRLLAYLSDYAAENGATIFLTTHSSTALDFFGSSERAQIVHVRHDGECATASTVSAHLDRIGVVAELGARSSDLLQANGIVWVEGPSDRLYLDAWIKLVSGDELQEGRDFICAFYGGSLLGRAQFAPPESAIDELVNLFRVNPNVIVVCDSDKDGPAKHLKPRVRRVREEVEQLPGSMIWVTAPREIENYIPGSVLGTALAAQAGWPDPTQFESFFAKDGAKADSYVERVMKRKGIDKVELAALATPLITLDNMRDRFDWEDRMTRVVEVIRSWGRD